MMPDRNELAEYLAKKFPWLLADVSQFKLADAIIEFLKSKESHYSDPDAGNL